MDKKNSEYKSIFSYNTDWNKNAYLNWQMRYSDQRHNFNIIAKGYMHAAIDLAAICLADNSDKKSDELIFPILFNCNHAIELYLKSIMWSLHWLLDLSETYSSGHDIKQLYQTVCALIKQYCKEYNTDKFSTFNVQNKNLKEYIDELYLFLHPDNNGIPENKESLDFSRYPLQSDKKTPYIYAGKTDKEIAIDLQNIKERIQEIGNNLDTIADYFDCMLDEKIDYESTIQQELESEIFSSYYDIGYYWR